jgi:hypothetical protein
VDGVSLFISVLSPVLHPTNDKLHRVPVQKIGSLHILFVGDHYRREIDEKDLPGEVKTKMAMVIATSKVDVRDHAMLPLQIYVPPDSGAIDEVGWQVSDTMFCLCLSQDALDQLTGKSI